MAHWLDEFPPLRVMQKHIAAKDYNCIRLGLIRERLPLQLRLKDFRCLLFILDESAWICIDECQNDLPVLAWTNFKTAQRSALHQPVECELRLYHMHAGLVMGTVLDALVDSMAEHGGMQSRGRRPLSQLKR